MFVVDEPTAEAIRRAYDVGGELSGIVEFGRHFPLITDTPRPASACGSSPGGSRRRSGPSSQQGRPALGDVLERGEQPMSDAQVPDPGRPRPPPVPPGPMSDLPDYPAPERDDPEEPDPNKKRPPWMI